MHPCLHRLSLATATLLLSLTSPLQLVGITPRLSVVQAQEQTLQDQGLRLRQLLNEGTQQLNSNQLQPAIQTFQQTLALSKQIHSRPGEWASLAGIGRAYDRLRQYSQALEFYQQALVIAREDRFKTGEELILSNTGEIYTNQGQYAKALEFYQQALAVARELGDKAKQGLTLNRIGSAFRNQGQYPKALEFFQEALAIRTELGDKSGQGTTLNNIGEIYAKQGQYTKALEFLQQALTIAREIGDRKGEGITIGNIATVYKGLGQYTKALESFQQVLAIAREIGDRQDEQTALSNIATVYTSQGQYAEALKFLQQVLAIKKEIGDKAAEGTTLNNIAAVYNSLGQYPNALEFLQQALAIERKIGDKAAEGTTLNNIATVYGSQNQYEKALGLYQQVLTIRREVGDRSGEGATLSNIGAVYLYQEQYGKALEFLQQALVIVKEVGDRAEEGKVLNNIGLVYKVQGQDAKAQELYQQALAIRREVGDKAGEGVSLNNIGVALLQTGKLVEAEKTLRDGIEILESLRPGLTDSDKVSIFDTQAKTYRFLQQALIAQNKTQDALEISERSRARAFVELLAKRLSSQAEGQNLATLQQSVQPTTIAQIQQIAKEEKATLVEYSILDSGLFTGLFIWVVKPTGEIAFKQVDLKAVKISLQDLVYSSRDSIGVRDLPIIEVRPRPGAQQRQEASLTEQLQQLHKLLIEPIADLLPTNPNDRVIFIPQSSLFLVPFPALQDKDGKYLIEKHTILTAPSIQVLQLTHEQRQKRGNRESGVGSGNALVVGNPTMPSVPPAPGEKPQQLPSLPGAEKEAEKVAPLLNTKPLIGNLATKAAVLQQLPKARIIHLATHGLLDDVRGLGSAIALAPDSSYKEEIGKVNGLLTAEEILDLKLNAELVVLSACNTGRGRITGDGVIGLSRSLISAGVPSVLVSLWSVPDAPTAQLMSEFYQNLQKNPDKAQALRQAMLTILKNNRNTPKNWAAFTLIGESN